MNCSVTTFRYSHIPANDDWICWIGCVSRTKVFMSIVCDPISTPILFLRSQFSSMNDHGCSIYYSRAVVLEKYSFSFFRNLFWYLERFSSCSYDTNSKFQSTKHLVHFVVQLKYS
jgi:hypothetical protein